MKFTTRAFKLLISDMIQKFEKEYPDPALQKKANVYKAKLHQYIAMTNTSALLRTQIEKEIDKMPYYFSRIGYLVKDLRNLLKDNSARDCMETDEYEKNELESLQQRPVRPREFKQTLAEEQLEKEQAKNKKYTETIKQLTNERDDILQELQKEVQKSQQYQTKLQDLFTKMENLTQDNGKTTEDINLVKELQQFNKDLLEANKQLVEEKKLIFEKYQEIASLNKKLKKRCDELEDNYKSLTEQFMQQSQLLNSKIAATQAETKQLKEDFEKRVKQLEIKQQTGTTSHFSRYSYFNKTKPMDIPVKKEEEFPMRTISAARENLQAILPEKCSY